MDSGWGIQKGSWKDAKPIGKDAEDFLLENADYAVYLRKRDDDPCPEHWHLGGGPNDIRTEGPLCPICWGTGRKITPIITPIRIFQGSVDSQSDIRTQPGYVTNWEIGAILPRSMRPNYQDIVLLVEWNIPIQEVPTNPNRRVVSIGDVTQVESLFDRFEREVAFIGVALKSYGSTSNQFEKSLPLMVGLDYHNPENRWQQTSYW